MGRNLLSAFEDLRSSITAQFTSIFVREHYEHAENQGLTSTDNYQDFVSNIGRSPDVRGIMLYNWSGNDATILHPNGVSWKLLSGAVMPLPFKGAASFKYKSSLAGNVATILVWTWA